MKFKIFSIASLIFVTVYAVMGLIVPLFSEFLFDFLFDSLSTVDNSKVLSVIINTSFISFILRIMFYIFAALHFVILFSWPFFGPLALITLLIKYIYFVKKKPEAKKIYKRDMILHLICSFIGMVGIFLAYYDKFGMPHLFR